MASEAVLTELVARIKADSSQLDRALADLPKKAQASTAKIAGAFALATYAGNKLQQAIEQISFAAWVRGAIDSAGRTKDLADQIGLSASSLVGLNALLIQNGSNMEQFTASVSFLTAQIGAAGEGNAELIKTFDRLGLSVTALKQLGPEKAYFAVVQALYQVANASERADLMRDLLSKGYRGLVPTFNEVNGQLGDFVDKQNQLNGPVLNESIELLDKVGDRFSSIANTLRNDFLVGLAATIKGMVRLNELWREYAKDSGQGAYAQGKLGAFEAPGANIPIPEGVPADQAQAYRDWYTKSMARGATVEFALPADKSANKPGAGNNRDLTGVTTATKQMTDAQRQAATILDQTRTAQEKYDSEMAKATQLWLDGNISLDTFNRYQTQLQDELHNTGSSLDMAGDKVQLFATLVKDNIGDAFEAALFDAKNFNSALTNIFSGIAKQIAHIGFIDPLSSALSSSISGAFAGGASSTGFGGVKTPSLISRLLDSLPSFDVGTNFVPHDMIAQIHRGERIVPANQNRGGGSPVIVQQTFNMSPGLVETVAVAIRNAAPSIAAAAHASVFQAIQGGGPEARIVGLRS